MAIEAGAGAAALAPAAAAKRVVPVLENVRIARDTYRLRLEDPLLARTIRPGQFVMVRPAVEGTNDPLLGRAFALYDVALVSGGSPIGIDVVYLVVGRGTAALARRVPGERLAIWGPLGNGFRPPPGGPVVFVAGGIGQTPFLALGKWWLGHQAYGVPAAPPTDPKGPSETARFSTSATLLYGARTAALLAGLDDFRAAGITVEVATDDGSAGHKGLVTDLLAQRLERRERPARIVGCGPAPMLASLASLARRHGVACDVSLENHMACGFGACFSCVAPILQPDGTTDLRRVCVEGPVFAAETVHWSEHAG